MKIPLALPVGAIVALRLVSLYPGDGTNGSVVFDALDENDAIVGQPARGALLAEASTPATLVEHAIDAAILAISE